MKIRKISLFAIKIPLKDGGIQLSKGRNVEICDSRVVKIETDTGLIGWGESVPWGTNYVPAFPQGINAGLAFLAPLLLGANPS
jgi:L-alanine-DL-glutamate epimerase-like enolase superfamily enzyme